MSNNVQQSCPPWSCSWSDMLRRVAVPIAVTLLASFLFQWLGRDTALHSDSRYYLAVAEGRIAEVPDPFTKRVLYPWVVKYTAQVTGMSIETSFAVCGNLAFIVLVVTLLPMIQRYVCSQWVTIVLFVTMTSLILAREIQLPDLLHASLLAVFLALLLKQRLYASLVILAFLQLTRESTILVTFFFVILTLAKKRWKVACLALAITVGGLGVAGKVSEQGLPNIHRLNPIVYLAAKVPFNFAKNVLGIELWADTFVKNRPETFPDEPLFRMKPPSWLPAGSIQEVGIYKFNPSKPLNTLVQLLTIFGVLPTLVLPFLFRRTTWAPTDESSQFVLPLAVSYGMMSYLLAPCLGASIARLIGYGWPCFWVAVPMLIADKVDKGINFWPRIALLHLIASWAPLIISTSGLSGVWQSIVILVAATPCHILAYRHIKTALLRV